MVRIAYIATLHAVRCKVTAPQHVVDAEIHRVAIVSVHISESDGGVNLSQALIFDLSQSIASRDIVEVSAYHAIGPAEFADILDKAFGLACTHDIGGAEFGHQVGTDALQRIFDHCSRMPRGACQSAVKLLVVIGQADTLQVDVEYGEHAPVEVYAVSGDIAVAVAASLISQG